MMILQLSPIYTAMYDSFQVKRNKTIGSGFIYFSQSLIRNTPIKAFHEKEYHKILRFVYRINKLRLDDFPPFFPLGAPFL